MEKLPQMAPNGARRIIFLLIQTLPTNPDLPDILGRTDLDFEDLCFFRFFSDPSFLDFQVPRSRNSRISGCSGSHPPLPGAILRAHPAQAQAWPKTSPALISGNLETWIRKVGIQQNPQNMEILKIKIHVSQNVGKVWIGGEIPPAPFHTI